MTIALTRGVSPALARCELSFLDRRPIDLDRACRQHAAYERELAWLGCDVRRLPADPEHPDCVFIEDTAVVVDEVAVIARPGAAARRGETAVVAAALGALRPLATIDAPATLDGGDVLRCGGTLYVGRSRRTNAAGAARLGEVLAPHGYRVIEVPVRDCLHLKSAVTALDDGRVLANPGRVDPAAFDGLEVLHVDPDEPDAANVLAVAGAVLVDRRFARTLRRLREHGVEVVPIDASELGRAEGGLTCCSILLDGPGGAT